MASSDNISPATTQASGSGTLVFLNVTPGTEFGIDLNVYRVGEKFRGVKSIPPGLHFVYYSAVNRHTDQAAPRTGFFHFFQADEMLVKEWDPIAEDISSKARISQASERRLRDNLEKGDLGWYLAPYPQDAWRKWVGLTSHISEALLHRLEPQQGKIHSATQYVMSETQESKNKEVCESQHVSVKTAEERMLPHMVAVPGTEPRYTAIPEKRYPDGSVPSEITKHGMDSTYILETILQQYEQPEDILGELQLTFVCFMIGHVYDAFEQWKRLVHILCTSDAALEKHQSLFLSLISVLHFQLKEIPRDFFVDIVENVNFLTSTLHVFFTNILHSDMLSNELKDRASKFKRSLTRTLKWDFDSEPPDEAPVVVEVVP